MPRLSRPLDDAAVAAADEALYEKYKDVPRPNSLFAADGTRLKLVSGDPLCSEWVDLYIAAGGPVDGEEPNHDEPGCVPGTCPQDQKGALEIDVIAKRNSAPIEGATVAINGPETHSGDTGPDGKVHFGGLTPGTYNLDAKRTEWKQDPGTGTATAPPGDTGNGTLILSATIEIRIVDDLGTPATLAPTELQFIRISDQVTSTQLPADYTTASTDRRNFRIDVFDDVAAGNTVQATWQMVKPDGNAFANDRTAQITCTRIPGSNWFRSKYLRLVVDAADAAHQSDQTILADWDSTDPTIEILGQTLKASYTRGPTTVRAEAEVTQESDRNRLKLGAFILRTTYGTAGTGVVTPANVQFRTNKWYRRVMAQAAVAPRLTAAPVEVDPPRNMVVISERTGARARGNANNRLRFFVRGAAGFEYTIRRGDTLAQIAQNHDIPDWRTIYDHPRNAAFKALRTDPNMIGVGDVVFTPAVGGRAAVVYRPPRNSTPEETANAMAAGVRTGGYTAVTAVNPRSNGRVRGSADIVIHDAAGNMAILENESSSDTRQSILVARVNTTNFTVGVGAAGFADIHVGSPMQRAVARNFAMTAGQINCIVTGRVLQDSGAGGLRGVAVPPLAAFSPQFRTTVPFRHCTFMAQITMDGTNANPFTFPHESGHAAFDVFHTQANPEQMMTGAGAGTSAANAIGASKRIYDSAISIAVPSAPSGGVWANVNQQTRLRASGAAVLEGW